MNNTQKAVQKDFISKFALENGEVFETDGKFLFCKACNIIVSSDKKSYVDQHLRTQKHLKNCKDVIQTDSAVRTKCTKVLNKYVLENSEVFETDGKELFCKICKKSISFETKNNVYRHLTSKKHKTVTHKNNDSQSKRRKGSPLADELLNKYVFENAEVFETDGVVLFCKDFCRTCLKQFSKAKQKDKKQNISEIPTGCQKNTSIMELLEIIQPQIKVEIKDNLPTLVCSDCIQKLLVSYEFIEMYQIVDKKLRKMLDEYDMENCNNNSEELQQEFLEEMEVPADFEENKYEIEIEPINIDGLDKEQNEIDNNCPELKTEPEQELTDGAEKNETVFSQPNSDDSDDEFISDKDCLNISLKEHNSDDVTKKVFKGFFQPEKNYDGTLTCELCESVLNGVMLWRDHIRKQHLEEKPKRQYNRNKPRKKGNQNHPKKMPPNEHGLYQCEYCEKSYPKYIFYRRHLRKHTEEPHLCIECGKSFSLLSSYTSHMLRHKGEKTFVCPHCPKSFVCSSGLYNHAITHTNNKPYVCDTCGSAFHMSYQLKKHNRIHTGVKKYQCEYCDMRFITGEKQRRHMRTHTGEKPYRCKYCERAFAQSNDCVKHLRQHLGDNVYQCDLCPLRYPLLRELRVHFASHKDEDEETRARNLEARMEAEKNLQIKLTCKESV